MSCANSASPLGLSWENITVSSDGKAISRGFGFGVGTPQQIVSLRPSIANYDTWLFNADDCVNDKNSSCIGQKGGVYNSSRSSTFSQTTKAQWNGTQEVVDTSDLSFIYFNDKLSFGTNGTSFGFPMELDQPGEGSQSGFGIGPKSDFIKAAVASGSAPTNSWGLWVGSRSVVQPVDGSLWVGGYDANRVEGSFTTFPTQLNCPTCVEITNITYVHQGGNTSLMSNSSETLWVELEPFSRVLEVPGDIFGNWLQASNGTVGTDPGTTALVTLNPALKHGNLSVTFSNGYTTVIPSQEFMFPPRLFNNNGVYDIWNNTYYVSSLSNTTTPGIYPTWGVPILTMNYMVSDFDNGHFKLAPARQGPYGQYEGPLAQPLCNGIPAVSTAPVGAPGTTPTSIPSTPTPTPTPVPSKTNVGAIAGGVVGGIAGLALIALLAFFLLRSKKKMKNLQEERDIAVNHSENLAQSERVSQYTATSPTEVSEIGQNKSIDAWLYAQQQQKQGHYPQEGTNYHPQQGANYYPHQGATVHEPFSMPAEMAAPGYIAKQ